FCIKNAGTATNVHAVVVAGGDRTIFSYHKERNYKLYDWAVPKWIHYSTLAPGFEKFQGELIKYLNAHPQTGVAFNPGSSQLKNLEAVKQFMEVTDILFVNKEEADKIVGGRGQSIKTLHSVLHKMGPKLTSITDGENGASTHDGKTFLHMDAYITS